MKNSDSLVDRCRDAVEKLDRAARLHPREIEKEVDQIQRDIVALRDGLIERLREMQSAPAAPRARAALDLINVALSLVVAVEYPITSIQRSCLEQARDTLKKILAEDGLGTLPLQLSH